MSINKTQSSTFERKNDVLDKVSKAQDLKAQGNVCFSEKKYKKALHRYHSALLYVKGAECDLQPKLFPVERPEVNLSEEEKESISSLIADLQNNIAACLLKQNACPYERVLECCKEVTQRKSDNLKALYRSALAYYHLDDYKKAKEAVLKAEEVSNGTDSAVRNLAKQIDKKEKEEDKETLKLYKSNFFNKPSHR